MPPNQTNLTSVNQVKTSEDQHTTLGQFKQFLWFWDGIVPYEKLFHYCSQSWVTDYIIWIT